MHVCISPLNLVFGGLLTYDQCNSCNLEYCCINNQVGYYYCIEKEKRQVVVVHFPSEGKKKTPLQRNAFNLRVINNSITNKNSPY